LSRTQLVELAGRHWLTGQLLAAGLEVARPERDHGIDLIVYADLDAQAADFVALPVQMKAASTRSFSLNPRYERFYRLLLVYVWYVDSPAQTTCYALTYIEALTVAADMGWTKTASWLTGAATQRRGYVNTQPGERLVSLLQPYQMNPQRWRERVLGLSGTP
jgi:hypothetical protein